MQIYFHKLNIKFGSHVDPIVYMYYVPRLSTAVSLTVDCMLNTSCMLYCSTAIWLTTRQNVFFSFESPLIYLQTCNHYHIGELYNIVTLNYTSWF